MMVDCLHTPGANREECLSSILQNVNALPTYHLNDALVIELHHHVCLPQEVALLIVLQSVENLDRNRARLPLFGNVQTFEYLDVAKDINKPSLNEDPMSISLLIRTLLLR